MYYVVYGFLWLLSLLPLRVLYVFSDALYGLIYYVFRYRKKVTLANLLQAFPEKTEKERRRIARQFYHNLVDTFIETIKMISAPLSLLEKRAECNWEVLNAIYPTGKSVQVHMGHNFNWEWGNALLSVHTPFKPLIVYMPLASKVMEKLFYRLRTRGGNVLLPATEMSKGFLPYRNTQYLMGLVADQNPGNPGNAWWFNFFGKPTPFLKGPARNALLNKTEVVFAFIHKEGRGRYRAVISPQHITGSGITELELTRRFVHYLENVIREYPEMWLWSHRRWKHEWKPEYGPVHASGVGSQEP